MFDVIIDNPNQRFQHQYAGFVSWDFTEFHVEGIII